MVEVNEKLGSTLQHSPSTATPSDDCSVGVSKSFTGWARYKFMYTSGLLYVLYKCIAIKACHFTNLSVLEFSEEEVKVATKGFAREELLGKGGFGSVYKGNVRGTVVAIKVLTKVHTRNQYECTLLNRIFSLFSPQDGAIALAGSKTSPGDAMTMQLKREIEALTL